jgi:hypothetical protein
MNSWVIIYSKFSTASTELVSLIEGSNIQIEFQGLCIDNKEIKKIIQKSTKFSIKYVPCILNIDKFTGIVQQYEGIKAFELINSLIPEQPTIEQPTIEQPVQRPDQSGMHYTSLDELDNPQITHPSQPTLKQKISVSEIMNTQQTSIEQLDKRPEINIPTIEVKRTGKPINVSDIMAEASSMADASRRM